MTWNYAYSTPIWLSFFTVLRLIALSVYCWQNAPVSDRHIRCPLVGSGNGAWDLGEADPFLSISFESASVPSPYHGFHSLPLRTGREVFPHPALRQPSSWSIQDIHCPGFA